MRLCRFLSDEVKLVGFYEALRVIPVQNAVDAYISETGLDLWVAPSENLLDYLPPDGENVAAIETLYGWIAQKEFSDSEGLGLPIDQVQILAPLDAPPKILLLAGNYAAHILERGDAVAEQGETFPYVFMKPVSTIVNPGDPIRIPAVSPDHIDWECELAVIIGRECRDVSEETAMDHVAGYTIINDISDRKFRPNPGRKLRDRDKFFDWLHGKWHDTFLPIGPCITSSDAIEDPQDLRIRLDVNELVRQDATTGQMIFPVAAVIEFMSRFMTLEPGDLIATGTPAGVGSASGVFLRPGDWIRASISGIGALENPVKSEE